MGILRRMGRTGDTAIAWPDTGQATEEAKAAIAEAERIFREHRQNGYLAFALDRKADGSFRDGEQIEAFDPAADEIVLMGPIAGG